MLFKLKQFISVWLIKLVQYFGPRKVTVLGRPYEISPHVFNPRYYFTSMFMAKNMQISPDDLVLDMGTGSGIQAITAGAVASKVVAIDINPEAVRYAKNNILANKLEDTVSILEGDLFAPLHEDDLFDTILFTPPYMEGVVRTELDHALYDKDKQLIKRFFREAHAHLKENGCVQMLYSSIADHTQVLACVSEMGWRYSVMAQERTLSEIFFIYRLSRVHN